MLEWNWKMMPQLCIETGFFEQSLKTEDVEPVQDLSRRCSKVKTTLEGRVDTIRDRLLSYQINQLSDRVLSTEMKIRNPYVQMQAHQLERAFLDTSQYMDRDAVSREIRDLFHLAQGGSLDPETQSCVLRCSELFLRKFPEAASDPFSQKAVREQIRSIEAIFRSLESLWKEVVSRTVEFARLTEKDSNRGLLGVKIKEQNRLLKEKIAALPEPLRSRIYQALCVQLGFQNPCSMTQENAEKWFDVNWTGVRTVFHQEARRYLKSSSQGSEGDLSLEKKRILRNVRELLDEIIALPESEGGEVSQKLLSEKKEALWREFQELKKQASPDAAKELSGIELYIKGPQSFDKATWEVLVRTYEELIEPLFDETRGLPLDLLKRHMQTGYGVGKCGALLLQQLDSGGDIEGLAELHRLHDAVFQELEECQKEINGLEPLDVRDVLTEQNKTFRSHLEGIQGFRKVVSLVVNFQNALKDLSEKITLLGFSEEIQRDVSSLHDQYTFLRNTLVELSGGNLFWDACNRTFTQCKEQFLSLCQPFEQSQSVKSVHFARDALSSALKEWFHALNDGKEDSQRVSSLCQRMIETIRSCSGGETIINSICQQVALFANLEIVDWKEIGSYPDALQTAISCALEDRGEKIQ